MSLGNDGTTMLVQPAYGGYGNGGGFGFGGDNAWWIVLFLIFGWGRNGNGGGFGGENGGVGSEVQRGFDHSAVVTKLDGITTGIADATYALNNTMTNGFHGVDTAICNLGYQTQAGFNALGAQMASCCCETQRQIERGFCDTQNSINASTQQILNFLTQDKIATLTAENQSLKFQASQTAQNGFIDAVGNSIVAQLRMPTPVPAYQVPNPYANYGYNCGCGGYGAVA